MKILLIISGSIAAYKSLDLISSLKKQNHQVTCVMTQSAQRFISPLVVTSISGQKIYTDLFHEEEGVTMSHINLSREHDVILVAPATANIIAKMANGLADDLASNVLLASDKPVYVAPAMNVKMWGHSATQYNIRKIEKYGAKLIGPASGMLACGEEGFGRLEEIEAIIDTIHHESNNNLHLRGKTALVTSGPTVEAIDPVRYISNYSSGKQGYAIAESLMREGAEVTLITGPSHIDIPTGISNVIKINTAQQMLEASCDVLPVDIAICAAAVSDWRVKSYMNHKIKKKNSTSPPELELTENPDILRTLSNHYNRPQLVIGFAAETDNLIAEAKEKIHKKNCDWIVANDVSNPESSFGSDTNKVCIIDRDNTEKWPLTSKKIVADSLVKRIIKHFSKEEHSHNVITMD